MNDAKVSTDRGPNQLSWHWAVVSRRSSPTTAHEAHRRQCPKLAASDVPTNRNLVQQTLPADLRRRSPRNERLAQERRALPLPGMIHRFRRRPLPGRGLSPEFLGRGEAQNQNFLRAGLSPGPLVAECGAGIECKCYVLRTLDSRSRSVYDARTRPGVAIISGSRAAT